MPYRLLSGSNGFHRLAMRDLFHDVLESSVAHHRRDLSRTRLPRQKNSAAKLRIIS